MRYITMEYIFKKQGYSITGSPNPLRMGQQVFPQNWKGEKITQPMYVIGESSREEFIRQHEMVREVFPDTVLAPERRYYYKLSTD